MIWCGSPVCTVYSVYSVYSWQAYVHENSYYLLNDLMRETDDMVIDILIIGRLAQTFY